MQHNTVDSPPIFEMGFHPLTLLEIREHCVDPFPLSSTREIITVGITKLIDMLESAGVQGILWMDGSFATKRINPDDADIVFVCQGPDYDDGSPDFRAAIDLLNSNLKKDLRCDTKTLVQYPAGHPLYTESFWLQSFFVGRWGWTDGNEAKGIITLQVGGQNK